MDFITKLKGFFNNMQPIYALEFVLLTVVFFLTLNTLRKNNAKPIIWVFVLYTIAVSVVCLVTGEEVPGYTAVFLIAIFVLAVVVMFATEIKRDVWESSTKGLEVKHSDHDADGEDAKTCIDEIIKAVQSMSKNNVGAIIILANSNMPAGILDTGVSINAQISAGLIESIFFPKTPLHDGAMIINDTRIQAAGCFLPTSQKINLPKELGTRHRAGIGITENINVTAIIISEETGVISVAHGGQLKRYADTEMLKNTLRNFYWKEKIN